MRKTLNINLGGLAFIIDENAFDLLHNYLEALKRKFGNESERDEIINDIEARIAEMLNHRLADRKEVVSVEDVQFVMDAMGKPEDIAGEEPGTSTSGASGTSAQSATTAASSPSKRLFRDPDDARIGGVISGLCHYFGISEPIWMRIAALILIFFTGGSVIFIYILLLVIVPKANTSAEKLQMKGEPININTIEKEIKDAAGKASESVHNFVNDRNFFEKLWEILAAWIKTFAKVFALLGIGLSMLIMMVLLFCFFIFYVIGTGPLHGAAHLLVDAPSTLSFFSFGFLLFFGSILVGLIYLALKILLGQRSRVRWLKGVLIFCWLFGLGLLAVTGFKIGTGFLSSSSVKNQISIMQPARGSLFVQLTDTSGNKIAKDEDLEIYYGFHSGTYGPGHMEYDFSQMGLIPVGNPELILMPSETDSFYLTEVVTARGRNGNDANRNAEAVVYRLTQTDTTLNLGGLIYLNKSDRWRVQNMKIRLAIPEGKKIRFADNIDLWEAIVKGDLKYNDTEFANTLWTNEKGVIKCIEGENHNNVDEDNDVAGKQVKKTHRKIRIRDSDDDDKTRDF